MGAGQIGDLNLRDEDIDRLVKGFALQRYVFKDSLMVNTSNSWKETFYKETAADLTAKGTRNVKGVGRLSKFPTASVVWNKETRVHQKYAIEDTISWEDAQTNEIDVVARTLQRIGRAVAKAVDDEIYSQVSTNAGNSVTITAGSEWDSSNQSKQDPIKDILNAVKECSKDNYDVLSNSGELWFSPTDFANVLANANVRNAGQFWTSDVTKNGKVGRLVGLNVKVSNSVTDDEAIVMIPKTSGTWKQAHALTTNTINDPGIKLTIRAWEVGVTQITNPDAICKISNTQA